MVAGGKVVTGALRPRNTTIENDAKVNVEKPERKKTAKKSKDE